MHNLLVEFDEMSFCANMTNFISIAIKNYADDNTEKIYIFLCQIKNEMEKVFYNNNFIIAAMFHLTQIIKHHIQQKVYIDNFIAKIAGHKQIQYCSTTQFKEELDQMIYEFNQLRYQDETRLKDTVQQLIKPNQNVMVLSANQYLIKFLEQIDYSYHLLIHHTIKSLPKHLQNISAVFYSVEENQLVQKADIILFEPEVVNISGQCLSNSHTLSAISLANYYRKPVYAVTSNFYILKQNIQEQKESPIINYKTIVQQSTNINVLSIKNALIQSDQIDYYIVNGEILKPNAIYIKHQNPQMQEIKKKINTDFRTIQEDTYTSNE